MDAVSLTEPLTVIVQGVTVAIHDNCSTEKPTVGPSVPFVVQDRVTDGGALRKVSVTLEFTVCPAPVQLKV